MKTHTTILHTHTHTHTHIYIYIYIICSNDIIRIYNYNRHGLKVLPYDLQDFKSWLILMTISRQNAGIM